MVTAEDQRQSASLHALDDVVVGVGHAPEEDGDEAKHLTDDKLEEVTTLEGQKTDEG